ncbi:MAG: glycosyltransferase family 39 protein [Candidatus Omnitrophica bacterium]|nr:glycosyltransferase family 39 protein [Candidatus Omnitrophota bacterium]
MNKPSPINTSNKKFLLVLLAFIVFTLIIVSCNLHKPFNLDEGDFAIAAQRLKDNPKFFSEDPGGGLWHPPMYIYSLAAAFKIFGESTVAARGLGFFFYILTIIFVSLICKEFFKPEEYRMISVIAVCLCLINPLMIQFALLLDIDGGLLTLLLTVFCYFFARFYKRGMNIKRMVILGFIFGVSMLAKFTTPPLFVPAVFVFYFLRRDYKKAFVYSFLLLVIGVAVFWAIWGSYCLLFDVQPLYPFHVTFGTKWGQGGFAINQQKIMLVKSSLLYQWYWVSPAFVMLMVFSIVDRFGHFIKRKTVDDADFLMILGIGIFLYYFYYFPRQSMMKYQIPLYPLFAIVISRFFYNVLIKDRRVNIVEIIIICVCAVVTFVYYLFHFPDMVLWLERGEYAVSDFFKSNYNLFLKLYFLPFLCLPLLFRSIFEKKSFYFCLVAALWLLTVSTQIVQNIKQTEDYTTANSWHNYGEKGQAQATRYLHEKLSPDGIFISRKDIGYYLRISPQGALTRTYIYNSIFRRPKQEAQAEMEELMKKHDIEYVQLDKYCDLKNAFEVLSPYYYLDKQFDDFFVLRKK